MAWEIEFWFAVTSPSSYLASLRIDAVGARHWVPVRWHPFNIRKALEVEGLKPNVLYERKRRHTRDDFERTVRAYGHSFRFPEPFGRSSLPATAIAYWGEMQHGHPALKDFCRRVMEAYFVHNQAIDEPDVLEKLAEQGGLDPCGARSAIEDSAANGAVETATQAAIDKGCGAPPS